jgi:hypothetical protein
VSTASPTSGFSTNSTSMRGGTSPGMASPGTASMGAPHRSSSASAPPSRPH